MKKLLILTFTLLASLLVACSGGEDEPASEQERQPNENENTELTGQVLEEDGVINGSVYTEEGKAIGTMILEASVNNERAEELANKYADQLKEEYPDSSVNVQAVKDGENVANVTRE
ncbi:hypothetical protein LCM20_10150 [Halobacillus litoralis]|uniref:hypothetical protein n=1 Tax=Halobacillus litoralis TaxID=45668 RepID=UPI001CD273F0|nr:hypothetical protein [Halobacillus litoralis]MCA0970952.1 hypothetical protein [Halobacillus litoralis]